MWCQNLQNVCLNTSQKIMHPDCTTSHARFCHEESRFAFLHAWLTFITKVALRWRPRVPHSLYLLGRCHHSGLSGPHMNWRELALVQIYIINFERPCATKHAHLKKCCDHCGCWCVLQGLRERVIFDYFCRAPWMITYQANYGQVIIPSAVWELDFNMWRPQTYIFEIHTILTVYQLMINTPHTHTMQTGWGNL